MTQKADVARPTIIGGKDCLATGTMYPVRCTGLYGGWGGLGFLTPKVAHMSILNPQLGVDLVSAAEGGREIFEGFAWVLQ